MTEVRSLRSGSLLKVSGLHAGWGRQPVLRDLSFAVGRGERVAVLGPNGAGKSTLFDALAGRLRPSDGRILLSGEDVTSWPLHLLARRGVSYVPQEATAFAGLSVRDNLSAALRSPARQGPPVEGEVEDALRAWDLTDAAERQAAVLSGGERRRLEVARALLLRPRLLVLDEPFAGLDPAGRAALRAGLETVPPRTAVLVSDHAADDVLSLADRVLLILDGQLAFDGPRRGFSPELPAYRRYFGSGLP